MKSKIYLSLFLASVVLSAQPTSVGTATIKQNPATEKVQPVQLPVLEKKNPQKQYEAVIKMLESKESTKVQRAYEDKKAQEQKQKEEDEAEIKKFREDLGEMLLPIPLRSIIIGDKIQVFAEYREKKLSDNASVQDFSMLKKNNSQPLPGAMQPTTETEKKIDAVYEKKTIELKQNDSFGDWRIKTLTLNYVEYEHKKDNNKIVKKYY